MVAARTCGTPCFATHTVCRAVIDHCVEPALRRRGVAEQSLAKDHIAPHAAIPVITVFGLELAFLLEGLVLVEVILVDPA